MNIDFSDIKIIITQGTIKIDILQKRSRVEGYAPLDSRTKLQC